MRQVQRTVGPRAHRAERFLEAVDEPARRAGEAVDVDDSRAHGQRLGASSETNARLNEQAVRPDPGQEEVHASIAGQVGRYLIEVEGGGDLSAKGNVVDHEYKIERDGETVAEVSKRWFRVRDTYGIEVAPGQDDALILAITVCIDRMGRG